MRIHIHPTSLASSHCYARLISAISKKHLTPRSKYQLITKTRVLRAFQLDIAKNTSQRKMAGKNRPLLNIITRSNRRHIVFHFSKAQHHRQFTKHNNKLQEIVGLIAYKTNRHPKLYGGGYILCCPAHNDKKPSLSVREGDDGRVLLHCFNGCTIQEICAAIGIALSYLFPAKRRQ